MTEREKFLLKLGEPERKFLEKVLNFRISRISWDLDQVLANSEEPVKRQFDEMFGTSFRQRKIDRWRALTAWATADGFREDHIRQVEEVLWIHPDILSKAPPNISIQDYSRAASERNIVQYIVTSRLPHLHKTTRSWLNDNFPWISEANLRIREDTTLAGPAFKTQTLREINPDLHFEDTLADVKEILSGTTGVRIIYFPRELDRGMISDNERVIEIPDMKIWADLVAQS